MTSVENRINKLEDIDGSKGWWGYWKAYRGEPEDFEKDIPKMICECFEVLADFCIKDLNANPNAMIFDSVSIIIKDQIKRENGFPMSTVGIKWHVEQKNDK